MVFPLISFVVGVALLYYMFEIGWSSGPLTEDDSTLLLFLLGGLVLCVLSLIVWGVRSESNRHRRRWMALILAAILLIILGAWWIISLGLFIAAIGLALLIYSSVRLVTTLR